MFKVGDMVECLASTGYEFTKGRIYEVERVEDGGDWLMIKMDDSGSTTNGWAAKFFKPVKYGPIRTVTRREIVPGPYGRVEVSGTYKGERVTLDWSENGSVHTAVPIVGLNAEELREAAHLFFQLAEALEDKS